MEKAKNSVDGESINILRIEDNPGDVRLVREMLAEKVGRLFDVQSVDDSRPGSRTWLRAGSMSCYWIWHCRTARVSIRSSSTRTRAKGTDRGVDRLIVLKGRRRVVRARRSSVCRPIQTQYRSAL